MATKLSQPLIVEIVIPILLYLSSLFGRELTSRLTVNGLETLFFHNDLSDSHERHTILAQFLKRFDEVGNLSFGKAKDRYYLPFHEGGYFEIGVQRFGTWTPKQKRGGKGGSNVKAVYLASKPHEEDRPVFKTSRKALLPIDGTDYVYLIKLDRQSVYKIGKSNNPKDRLKSLQTSNPYKLKLAHAFKTDNATAAEEVLHQALHQKRMEGEWFKLSRTQEKALLSISAYQDKFFIVNDKQLTVEQLLQTSPDEPQN